MQSKLFWQILTSLCVLAVSQEAVAVSTKHSKATVGSVFAVTTGAADRARSDVQIRRLKNLLASDEIANPDELMEQMQAIRQQGARPN